MSKIIPPRRDEILSKQGVGELRFLNYLEENADQTNNSTEATEADPATINLSNAQVSQINKKIAEIVSENLISQNAIVSKLNKRIEQLENNILSNNISKLQKEIDELKNNLIAPFYKTKYERLTIKSLFTDNVTIDEKLKLPLDNDAASPTVQFGDGDSGFYEESDDKIAMSLAGSLAYSWDTAQFTTPNGEWSQTGINILSGDAYRINGLTVLSGSTLGSGVTSSSLTSLGTLTAVNTSGVYSVATTQVVGPRGVGVSDADGTLASATAQLNALLARIRAHGLIS